MRIISTSVRSKQASASYYDRFKTITLLIIEDRFQTKICRIFIPINRVRNFYDINVASVGTFKILSPMSGRGFATQL